MTVPRPVMNASFSETEARGRSDGSNYLPGLQHIFQRHGGEAEAALPVHIRGRRDAGHPATSSITTLPQGTFGRSSSSPLSSPRTNTSPWPGNEAGSMPMSPNYSASSAQSATTVTSTPWGPPPRGGPTPLSPAPLMSAKARGKQRMDEQLSALPDVVDQPSKPATRPEWSSIPRDLEDVRRAGSQDEVEGHTDSTRRASRERKARQAGQHSQSTDAESSASAIPGNSQEEGIGSVPSTPSSYEQRFGAGELGASDFSPLERVLTPEQAELQQRDRERRSHSLELDRELVRQRSTSMSVALGKSLDAGGGPSSAAHTRSVQRNNSETLAALHSARSISFPDATPSALLAASNRRSQSTLMGPSTSSGIGNILEPGANSLVPTSAASRMHLRLATSPSSPARTRSKSVPATPKGLAAPDQRNKLLSFLPGVLPDGRLSAAEIPPRTSSHFYEPFFAPFEGKETSPPLWRRERPISGAGGSGRISALSHIWSSGDWFTTQQLLEGIEMDRRDYGENAPDLRSYSTLFAAQTRAEMLHHLEALDALQPRLPADTKALRPLRLRSTLAQVHHRLLLLVSYAHVPATIFLDYNAIYTLVQLAIFPSTPGTAVAWWVAAGVYAAFTIFWLAGIVVIWEGLVAYRRIWTEPRPAVLPIYLSSAVFTLSSIRSFSLYSLLYRVRCSARPVDAALETMWYYRQNWPTVATLAPRAIICAVVLALYHPFSPFAALNGRDSTYFSQERDELTTFAYVVLIINASWAAWRLLLVLASATLLYVGERYQRRRQLKGSATEDRRAASTGTDRRYSAYRDFDDARTQSRAHSRTGLLANFTKRDVENGWRSRAQDRVRDTLLEFGLTRATQIVDESAAQVTSAEALEKGDGQERDDAHPSQLRAYEANPTGSMPLITEPRPAHPGDWAEAMYEEASRSLVSPIQAPSSSGKLSQQREASSALSEADVARLPAASSTSLLSAPALIGATGSLPLAVSSEPTLAPLTAREDTVSLPRGSSKRARDSDDSLEIIEDAAVAPTGPDSSASTSVAQSQGSSPRVKGIASVHSPRVSGERSNGSGAGTPEARAKDLESAQKGLVSSHDSNGSKPGRRGRATSSVSSLAESLRNAFSRTTTSSGEGSPAVAAASNPDLPEGAPPVPNLPPGWSVSSAAPVNKGARKDDPSSSLSMNEPQPTPWWSPFLPSKSSRPSTAEREAVIDEHSGEAGSRTGDTQSTLQGVSEVSGDKSTREKSSRVRPPPVSPGQSLRRVEPSGETEPPSPGPSAHTTETTSTEDSDERRLWNSFPEQSRRHPPGLIALELEQKRVEALAKRDPERTPTLSTADRVDGAASSRFDLGTSPALSLSALTPVDLVSSPDSERGGLGGFPASQATELSVSPSQGGLIPIKEESWSSSLDSAASKEPSPTSSQLKH